VFLVVWWVFGKAGGGGAGVFIRVALAGFCVFGLLGPGLLGVLWGLCSWNTFAPSVFLGLCFVGGVGVWGGGGGLGGRGGLLGGCGGAKASV